MTVAANRVLPGLISPMLPDGMELVAVPRAARAADNPDASLAIEITTARFDFSASAGLGAL